MSAPIPRGVRTATTALVLPVLVGCGHHEATATTSTTSTSISTPSPRDTSPNPRDTSSSDPAAIATSAPPPSMTASPAPSTAGTLTQASFLVPRGWTPTVADISEQGLTPNGVPVHARDGAELTLNMLQPCGTPPRRTPPIPAHALEMNLKKGSDLGVGELIEFSTPAQATAWFTTLRTQLGACHNGVITATQSSAGVWRGRENLGADGDYAKVDVLRGNRVVDYALMDPRHTVDTTALVRLVQTGH